MTPKAGKVPILGVVAAEAVIPGSEVVERPS